jgi:CubicO group peptidase (beta-lactamase class C family)
MKTKNSLRTRSSLASALPAAVLSLSLLTLAPVPRSHAAAPAAPAAAAVAAAADTSLVQALDALAAENFPADEPGAAVLVETDGPVLLRKGCGPTWSSRSARSPSSSPRRPS